MFNRVSFVNDLIFMGLFILFNSLQIYFEFFSLFNIGLDIILEMLVLGGKFL